MLSCKEIMEFLQILDALDKIIINLKEKKKEEKKECPDNI